MRLTDIVAQLQLVLPQYTDYFSNTLAIESIVVEPTIATIKTTSAHGLLNNKAVTISEVSIQNGITAISKDGLIYTLDTDIKHDLSYGYPGYETVTLGGFTSYDWNDDFTLTGVPNRDQFNIQSANTIPTLNGSEYLLENRIDGVNGRFSVTVIDATTFTISGSFEEGVYLGGYVKTKVRIAASINIDRTLQQYTKKEIDEMWAFVSMHDATASKDRNAYNDGVATFANGEDIRLRIIDGFSVFLIANVSESIAAVDAIDIFRHELLGPILKSLYGVSFPTGLSESSDFKAIITGHGQSFYDRATLVYQYNFQFTNDITIEDGVENQNTRAFTKLKYVQRINPEGIEDNNPTSFPLPFPIDFDESAIPHLSFQTELPEETG